MELSLIRGIVPQTVFGVTAVAALVLLIGLVVGKRNRAHRMHPLIVSLIVAVAAGAVVVVGGMVGIRRVHGIRGLARLAGDLYHRRRHRGGRLRNCLSCDRPRLRRVVAIILVPLILVSTALGVDSIYGEYQTIGNLVGYSPYASLSSVKVHESAMSVDQWRKRAQRNDLPDMPQTGKVLTVTIPNTKSNFAARPAMIYLPPAALSEMPPTCRLWN